MKPNAPTKTIWWLALILGILGILSYFVSIPKISGAASFWLVAIAFLLLILATSTKGL